VEPTTKRSYWRYLPKDYVELPDGAERDARRPLVVTFHGMKPFDTAKAQAREWQQEADRYGFVVIAPELKTFHMFGQFPLRRVNRAFQEDESTSLAILDHVLRTTHADPGNVLATSWSSGGYMAHYMLNRHPDKFTCLAVRQSNFSAAVMHPDITRRSLYHPILIAFTQNDFGICKRESREAVQWYDTHGYHNAFWVYVKDKGHERTPDLAAYFFALVCGAQPNSPPEMLVDRQAIDGNEEGLAFLAGGVARFQLPPLPPAVAAAGESNRSRAGARADDAAEPATGSSSSSAVPQWNVRHNPVRIRVSSAIGIEPLHLGFSAECPANWRETAQFRWSLDGTPIGGGINGQRTLARAGEHTLGLLVVTDAGDEYRATRTIRVLPRLEEVSSSGRGDSQPVLEKR
jgi:hypothetical protein